MYQTLFLFLISAGSAIEIGFGSKLPELTPFYLDNIRIEQVHKTKYLVLTANDKLSWNKHCKSIKEKVAGGVASRLGGLGNIFELIIVNLYLPECTVVPK